MAEPVNNHLKLPAYLAWMNTIVLPKMVYEALRWLGTAEVPGPSSNPIIMAWAMAVGAFFGLKDKRTYYPSDAVAWCGLFMNYVAKVAGKALPRDPLAAANWQHFGTAVTEAELALGDIIVFPHHVCMYLGDTPDRKRWVVIGGNQGDAVSIVPWKKGGAIAYRRPPYTVGVPDSVKKYLIDAKGTGDVPKIL